MRRTNYLSAHSLQNFVLAHWFRFGGELKNAGASSRGNIWYGGFAGIDAPDHQKTKCSFFAEVLQVYNKENHMKVEVKNGRIIISLKLRKPTASKSGKTLLVASTLGVRRSSVKMRDKWVRVIAHAFIDANRP